MSKPVNTLKHCMYIFPSSFLLSLGYILSIKEDENYGCLRSIIYDHHIKFHSNSGVKYEEGSLTKRYSFEQLIKYGKKVASSFWYLFIYPVSYRSFQSKYKDEFKLDTLEQQNKLINNVHDVITIVESNIDKNKKKFNVTSLDEESDSFNKNLKTALKWKRALLSKDDLTEEKKLELESPTVISLSQEDILFLKNSDEINDKREQLLKSEYSKLKETKDWQSISDRKEEKNKLMMKEREKELKMQMFKEDNGVSSLLEIIKNKEKNSK